MKNFFSSLVFTIMLSLLCLSSAFSKGYSESSQSKNFTSSHVISGYTKSNGTYAQPSHATSSNNTKIDNWSTKENINPYKGKLGTK